jgi:hypothetical protein
LLIFAAMRRASSFVSNLASMSAFHHHGCSPLIQRAATLITDEPNKADISECPSNVRFTPKSGHQTDPRYVRRNNFGSLAILVAIRRCGPQLTERTRATNSGVCIYADGTLSQQEQIAAARRL